MKVVMIDATHQFYDAMSASGLHPPTHIVPGYIHRFPGIGKRRGNKAGYCRMFEDCLAGIYGDWAQDYHATWKMKREKPISRYEQEIIAEELRTQRVQREQEQKEKYRKAAIESREELALCTPAKPDNPYLLAKGVAPHGQMENAQRDLVVSITDGEQVHSLQRISCSKKTFKKGGRISGMYHAIAMIDNPKEIFICEGIATGLTLYEDAQLPVVVAFNAGNLSPVTGNICWRYPNAKITICGDDDHSKEINVGLRAAREAAQLYGVHWTLPDFNGLNPSPDDTDFNDLRRLMRCAA
jgi:putative DNA primase/helicase